MIGMGGDKVLPQLTGLEEDSDEGSRLLDRRGEIFRSRLPADALARSPAPWRWWSGCARTAGKLVIATSASEEDLGRC
jgi:hypothetical protein